MFKKIFSMLFGGCEEQSGAASQGGGGLHDVEKFVDYVVRKLVDAPDAVKVSADENDNVLGIQIVCNEDDRGKIIGRRGKTINAIRALANGAAGRLQKKVTVEVVD